MERVFYLFFFFILTFSRTILLNESFQAYAHQLDQQYLGAEDYQYGLIANDLGSWYSTTASNIKFRQNININSTVMDTLNNNSHNQVCYNFKFSENDSSPYPYELALDYFIDGNIQRAYLAIKWNEDQIFYKGLRNKFVLTISFLVYSKAGTNNLCFEGWANQQSELIGVLVDNIFIIPYEIRNIHFEAFTAKYQPNNIHILSNLTLNSQSQLNFLKGSDILEIKNAQYKQTYETKTNGGYLQLIIEIQDQYYFNETEIFVNFPLYRNNEQQLIQYYVSSSKLPRSIYEKKEYLQMIKQSQNYLILLAKFYIGSFHFMRTIGFTFILVPFLVTFLLPMCFVILSIQLISTSIRSVLIDLLKISLVKGPVNFILQFFQLQFSFGSGYIPQLYKFGVEDPSYSLAFTDLWQTSSIYTNLIDTFAIVLLNVIKIQILCCLLHKYKELQKILRQIRGYIILIQIVVISPVIGLQVSYLWKNGIVNQKWGSKLILSLFLLMPLLILFFALYVFISQLKNLMISLIRARKQKNGLQSKYLYTTKFIKNLLDSLQLVSIPLLLCVDYPYLAIMAQIIMSVTSFVFHLNILRKRRTFYNFVCLLVRFMVLIVIICLLISKSISSINNLSQNGQMISMDILRVNSLSLIFSLLSCGFSQTILCFYEFMYGVYTFGLFILEGRKRNLLKSYNNGEIKIQQGHNQMEDQTPSEASEIKIINKLRERLDVRHKSQNNKRSQSQISNPFKTTVKFDEKVQHQDQESSSKPLVNNNFQDRKSKPKNKTSIQIASMQNIQHSFLENYHSKPKIRPKSSFNVDKQKEIEKKNFKKNRIKQNRDTEKDKDKGLVIKKSFFSNEHQSQSGTQTVKSILKTNFEAEQNFT